MPQKKTAKRAAKRRTKITAAVTWQQMEKDFQTAPTKMAAQLTKDVSNHRKKQSGLQIEINKIKERVKKTETRINTAKKIKHTIAGHKQLKAASKEQQNLNKTLASLNKELSTIIKSIDAAAQKQTKLLALRKNISQFDKTWASQAKKLKAAKATQKTTTSRPTKSRAKNIAAQAKSFSSDSHIPTIKSSSIETYNTTMNNAVHEDVADAVS